MNSRSKKLNQVSYHIILHGEATVRNWRDICTNPKYSQRQWTIVISVDSSHRHNKWKTQFDFFTIFASFASDWFQINSLMRWSIQHVRVWKSLRFEFFESVPPAMHTITSFLEVYFKLRIVQSGGNMVVYNVIIKTSSTIGNAISANSTHYIIQRCVDHRVP